MIYKKYKILVNLSQTTDNPLFGDALMLFNAFHNLKSFKANNPIYNYLTFYGRDVNNIVFIHNSTEKVILLDKLLVYNHLAEISHDIILSAYPFD